MIVVHHQTAPCVFGIGRKANACKKFIFPNHKIIMAVMCINQDKTIATYYLETFK